MRPRALLLPADASDNAADLRLADPKLLAQLALNYATNGVPPPDLSDLGRSELGLWGRLSKVSYLPR